MTVIDAETATDADPQFKDEPKGDNPQQEELEDAAFVNDKGDGTASLMKPKKPTRHHRARDSTYNHDGDRVDGDDALVEDYDETMSAFQAQKWHITSAAIFVIASLLYLAMACMIMDTYVHYFKMKVPREVYWADDDATWWTFFINGTDNYIPDDVNNADDDYSWYQWYNETAFPEDDIVWLPRIANADAPGYEPYVSKYMILYFLAALGFMITGVIEIVLARGYSMMIQILYYIMLLAACFGMVSAILTNKSPLWSNIANCASCNLWALEAIVIVAQRLRGSGEAAEYDEGTKMLCWNIRTWFWIADISFLIGTVGDALTSWIYIFEYDNLYLGVGAMFFALMWQICAFVYFAVSIYDWQQYKIYFENLGEYERELKAVPEVPVKEAATAVETNGITETTASSTAPPSKEDDSC